MTPPGQVAVLESWAGVCRAVWNTGLEQRRAYRRRGAWVEYVQQARELSEAKRDLPWLGEPPSDVLQQTLMDLDKACRKHGTWTVRWRSRSRWRASMRFPQRKEFLAVRRLGRKVDGVRLPKLGLHDRVFATPGEERRMLALQRRAARQDRNRRKHRATTSNRAKDTRAKLARLWARIRNRRSDFHQQLAHRYCQNNALIGIEALPITNMTASASGTVEEPGRNVAQKAGLNRAILNKGWGQFELALHHQARSTGTLIVKVNPAYTSQTCFACKHVARDNRESQAVFRCVACGHEAHADVNAGRNILARALAQATGRDGQTPPVNNGRISHGGKPPLVPRQPPVRSLTAAGIPSL